MSADSHDIYTAPGHQVACRSLVNEAPVDRIHCHNGTGRTIENNPAASDPDGAIALNVHIANTRKSAVDMCEDCHLYTYDAADDLTR
ncbi:MAG: hypothetical protein K2I39_05115, partial [Muribaculaceae bacterium]|nr:hypothetical protein [Muribaculaceae bacterium]